MNSRSDKFSETIARIPPSGIRRFFEFAAGKQDIISLGVGEPDFTTPWTMREQAWYHLECGHTSYTSNWGLEALRTAIAGYLSRYGLSYSPQTEILLTFGVSEAVDIVFRSILNSGDEIIIAEPCYVSYQPLAVLCGARPVSLDTSADRFIPTAAAIESLITPKTKALMLCSPNNPTGTMIPAAELEKIAALVKKYQLWVISDEVYAELRYDSEHVSIGSFPDMKDYSIILNGFSKSFAMTGWRIGFIACPQDLMVQVHKIHQYAAICAPIMSQYAALEGLEHGWEEVEKMRLSYRQRRNFMMKHFDAMDLPYVHPSGAFYLFADIRSTGLSSEEFAVKLITDYKVAVIPGNVFGKGGEGFIRCCYATELTKIRTALERIEQLLQRTRGGASRAGIQL